MAASATLREIRYVWFDQDDTLYSFRDTMHRALSTCLPIIHEHFPQTRETLGVAEMVQVRTDISERAERAGLDLVQTRREAFRETLLRYARHDRRLDDLLVTTYYETLRGQIWPFPDTPGCLRELTARGYVLGILSDGMSLVEELEIGDFFRHRVYAHDTGLSKPEPAIFEHAMSLAGAAPEECLLVGDNCICDVVGARDAGWTGVWLNRESRLWDTEAEPPELIATSLAELPELIAKLNTA